MWDEQPVLSRDWLHRAENPRRRLTPARSRRRRVPTAVCIAHRLTGMKQQVKNYLEAHSSPARQYVALTAERRVRAGRQVIALGDATDADMGPLSRSRRSSVLRPISTASPPSP